MADGGERNETTSNRVISPVKRCSEPFVRSGGVSDEEEAEEEQSPEDASARHHDLWHVYLSAEWRRMVIVNHGGWGGGWHKGPFLKKK